MGIPGVVNLPGTLKGAVGGNGGANDPRVKWTLIGLEDQLWGRAASLRGQLGAICCFQVSGPFCQLCGGIDSLSLLLIKSLHLPKSNVLYYFVIFAC